jgi:hypothetical protein
MAPQVADSLAIGVWALQNASAGPPSLPSFTGPPGWTAASAVPQFTTVAGANNIVQDSAYGVLPGVTVFSEQGVFSGGNFTTAAGIAQMIIIAPGAVTSTPSPTPTIAPTSSPSPSPYLGVRCVTQANSGSAAPNKTFTFSLACTPGAGDTLIASVYGADTTVPGSASLISSDIPAGFSKVTSSKYSGSAGQAQIASKVATGTETSVTVTDPSSYALVWAATVYDVQNGGAIVSTATPVSVLSPKTPFMAPQVADSLAIGVWALQNSAAGPPASPAFTGPTGWIAASGTPQFTTVAGANNIVQDSAYAVLPGTPVFSEQGVFSGGNFTTAAGIAQMIVIAPGAGVPTPPPDPTPTPTASPSPTPSPTPTPLSRPGFLGAFYRAVGSPAYGIFSTTSPNVAPSPYPAPNAVLFGPSGYCDSVAANGYSISTGDPVDPTKLAHVVNLDAKWTRSTLAAEQIDQTHIFGAGQYTWETLDSSQCAQLRNNIQPVVGIEAGPVMYDSTPGVYSPVEQPVYESASDFGAYCGAVAQHEAQAFPTVTRYSIPGNEPNTNPTMFPGGASQIAAYSEACYSAIKAQQPNAFVYGLELNMIASANAPAFVQSLYALGCKQGTCYDGIAMHLFMPWPTPSSSTPCLPATGGSYGMQCVTAIRTAANAPALHVVISETGYMVTSSVPNEATKATATVAAMKLFAQDPNIDAALYYNVDECALYPTGTFSGGCLIDVNNNVLPAYTALQSLAETSF